MMIQSAAAVGVDTVIANRIAAFRSTAAPAAATSSATVSISAAAREALAGDEAQVAARLAEIRAKNPINERTAEDMEYLISHDAQLSANREKMQHGIPLTAAEIEYEQDARGMVKTFANLSPAEKALYDKAVASGNTEAAAGISQIALVRMMGHTAGGANGTTYDPLNTEITAANIEKYFSHSIVDPTGEAQSHFQALIQFLQENPAA